MAYQSKSYRKFVATAATATLVASAVTPAFAASFTDVSDRYKEAVDYLVEQKITNGISETTFGTNQTIKRVDAAVLIAKALDLDVENAKDAGFKDVPARAVSYVNALKEEGIINGKTATSFGSAQNITRGEMALIIANAYNLEGNKANLKFTDVSDRYDEAVAALVDNKITFGKTETQFGTSASVTRGEFALFLHRLADDIDIPTIEEVSTVNDITVNEGAASVTLPSTVEVTLSNDEKATKAVEWNKTNLKLNTPGTYTLKGDVADTDLEASVTVVVKAVAPEVVDVSAITRTTITATIKALPEAKTNVMYTVEDGNGDEVKVKPVNLAKGETELTLTLVSPLGVDPTGVWTVEGVSFDLDAIKNYSEIVTAASNNNEVATLATLKKAGLKNIENSNITSYLTAINASTTKSKLSDIQEIITKVNESSVTAEEAAAAVKAINEATNQVQLLNALQNKAFARVNADWIVEYKTAIDAAGSTNTDTVAEIQALVQGVNDTEISDADTAANSVATQNAVTELNSKYTADDVAPATAKADAIKASNIKSAVFGVKEATTAATVYNALVKLSSLDSTVLPAAGLNEKLKADYLVAKNASNFTALTTADVKTNIVDAADTAAANAALTAIDGITSTTDTADVKAQLQKLADVTSQLGNSKFDLSKVVDARLADYRTALAALTTPVQTTDVETAIASVNAQANEAKNLATIKDGNATAVQVRDALTELAAGETANPATTAYLNASSQVKLEIAQFVIDNRSDLAASLTASLVTADATPATYANAVIKTAQAAQAAKVEQFNEIGNLTAATNSTTKAVLDEYAYAPYTALTAAQKVAVAEEINKLTKPTSATDATPVKLNFADADAVKTQAQANAYIDAAIAKVK
jgi:hypothetical protein